VAGGKNWQKDFSVDLKHIVRLSETEEGQSLAEAKIKQMTRTILSKAALFMVAM